MITIRRIEKKDREAIKDLVAGTGAFRPNEVDVAMELVDIALSRPEQDDYHPYVLAGDDGTIAAYVCFGKNPMTAATWDLYWAATRSGMQGKGYGKKIYAFAEEEVRKRGGRLFVIETSSQESYEGSRGFFNAIGYTLYATLPDYYDEGDDKLVYLKKLT